MRLGLFFKGLVGLAVALNAIGFLVGQHDSPDYNDEFGAMAYLFSNATYAVSSDGLRFLEVKAGPYRYKYDVASDNLKWELRDVQSISLLQRPRSRIYELERFGQWLGLNAIVPASAGAAAVVLKKSIEEPPLLKLARGSSRLVAKRALLVLAIGAGAGYGGYWIGYEDIADWENATFVSVLRNPQYYRRLAADFQICTLIKDYTGVDLPKELIRGVELHNAIAPFSNRHPSVRIAPSNGEDSTRTQNNSAGEPNTVDEVEGSVANNSAADTASSKTLGERLSEIDFEALDRALEGWLDLQAKKAPFCEALIDYALDPHSDNPFTSML